MKIFLVMSFKEVHATLECQGHACIYGILNTTNKNSLLWCTEEVLGRLSTAEVFIFFEL